jgi:glycine betaine/proline transport system substrate-binding protein
MSIKKLSRLMALLAVFALFAAACGDSDSSTSNDTATPADEEEAAPAPTEATEEETTESMEEEMADEAALPGEGVTVKMGRATWDTGYFQAEVYAAVMRELGFDIGSPSDIELGVNAAYTAMAEGDMDFWVNSWYPGHMTWHAAELTDGSLIGDHISIVGEEMIAGGLQGFLITKSFADEYGVYTMEDLDTNAEALAAFDLTDPVPGNGKADIFGCEESFTCDNIITSIIEFAGSTNIQQSIASYEAMFVQAVDAADSGVPMVIYTWTPSSYITQLRPGDNVYWLGTTEANVLDDSNPTGTEGGEGHDQRPGTATIGSDLCPSGDGATCVTGWAAADIQVTASNDFLAANPAAEALLDAMKLSVLDVSLANVAQGAGATPEDLASEWIANNRDQVDAWLSTALAAA